MKRWLSEREGEIGRHVKDTRLFINAVFWILGTGPPWRDLPPDFGDWKNTHRRFSRWRDRGVWKKLVDNLCGEPDLEWVISTHIKVHQHGTGTKGGSQAMARTKGGSTRNHP
jgi:transposase